MIPFFLLLATSAFAQADLHFQRDFPPEEFRARWQTLYSKMGDRGLALIQGYPKVAGFVFPRQNNEFYYLCGVETPQSYLLLDAKSHRATLLLPPRDERLERSEGRVLSASDSEFALRVTGVDEVLSTAGMTVDWLQTRLRDSGGLIYTPHAPSEGYAQSRHEIEAANAAIAADYWDGRVGRETNLISLLRTRLRNLDLRDLTPLLDEMRIVKSPREVALIRRASQIAGRALLEAMRTTRPGLLEYHLDAAARYIFLVNDARLDAYRSITATGPANIWNAHYYRNNGVLRDGDLVLMDYAPDYHYYVSDIARMWPVNGRFDAQQRELLGIVLEYRNQVMARIRPGLTPAQILKDVRSAMEPILARTKFSKPAYEAAARKLVETGGGVFSHPVGMAVHDVGRYTDSMLKPGHVFSVDPQLWVPEEKLYFRYEDVVAINETGYENFTDFLPIALADIERTVKGDGIVQKFPPSAK